MDVLEELDIPIEYIEALMLNTELPIYEYSPISITIMLAWDPINITLLGKFGKIWNPQGMIATASTILVDCYNGHITYFVEDATHIFRVNGYYVSVEYTNIANDQAIVLNDRNNIITGIYKDTIVTVFGSVSNASNVSKNYTIWRDSKNYASKYVEYLETWPPISYSLLISYNVIDHDEYLEYDAGDDVYLARYVKIEKKTPPKIYSTRSLREVVENFDEISKVLVNLT